MSKYPNITIIILGSIIVGFLNFYFIQSWVDSQESKYTQLIEEAYDNGLEDAVVTIITNTENCQPTALFMENYSKTVIDTRCVNFGN
jgi:hypothetical protein